MNILLFAPSFHGYEKDIINQLSSLGHNVDFVDCIYHPSIKDRIFLKFSTKGVVKKYSNYIDEVIANHQKDYDLFVTILGEHYLNKNHIERFRKAFPKAKFIYYAWDSIDNYPNILEFAPSFDEKLSFDPHDAEKYNFSFLPLFYRNEATNEKIEYDYSAFMTFHHQKAKGYKEALKAIGEDKIGFNYLYYFDKNRYRFNKFLHPKAFKGIPKKYFKFKTLPKEEVNHVIASSKAVIDVPLAHQNGLTIRVFEIIRQNKKIITSNKDIKKYVFYSPENIFIVGEDEHIPDNFWNSECQYNEKEVELFSLKTFVNQLCFGYRPLPYLKKEG